MIYSNKKRIPFFIFSLMGGPAIGGSVLAHRPFLRTNHPMAITFLEDVISGRQRSHLYKFDNWEQETAWFSTPKFFSTPFQRYRNFSMAIFLEWCRAVCKIFPISSINRARYKKIYIFAISSTAFAYRIRGPPYCESVSSGFYNMEESNVYQE